MTPIICLAGRMGSGKDSVAKIILDNVKKSEKISFADPIKNFVKAHFEPVDQSRIVDPETIDNILWGTSENRSKLVKLKSPKFWDSINRKDWSGMFQNEATASGIFREHAKTNRRVWSEGITARQLLQYLGTEVGRFTESTVWARQTLNLAFKKLEEGSNLIVIADGRFRNEHLEVSKMGGQVWRIYRTVADNVPATHPSELDLTRIPKRWYDATVINDGTMDSLEATVKLILNAS